MKNVFFYRPNGKQRNNKERGKEKRILYTSFAAVLGIGMLGELIWIANTGGSSENALPLCILAITCITCAILIYLGRKQES